MSEDTSSRVGDLQALEKIQKELEKADDTAQVEWWLKKSI